MKKPNKNIIILFPPRLTGKKLLEEYLKKGFSVFLLTFNSNDINFYETINKSKNARYNLYFIDPSNLEVPSDIKKMINKIDITINYLSSELLSLNVDGEDDEWRLNTMEQINQRFAFIDKLVKLRDKYQNDLWLNILNGKLGRGDGKPVYCKARYSMMGLEQLLKMNPTFANTRIISICTTYLKNMMNKDRIHHCAGCTKEEFSDLPGDIASSEKLLEFLVNKSIEMKI